MSSFSPADVSVSHGGGGVLDISTMEELDPSLSDGYRIIYDREVPVECRTRSGADGEARQGVLESLKVKMLMLGSEESPSSIRIELSSEADLFFHYMHVIDERDYKAVQIAQKLMIDFSDYHNVLTRMLNAVIREPHMHLAIFTMTVGTPDGRLDFIQNMEYKFVELMGCAFERSPEEVTQQHISFRYNAGKQRLALLQARLSEITTLVKTKNPSLLLQLQSKGSSKANSSSSSSNAGATIGNDTSIRGGGGGGSGSDGRDYSRDSRAGESDRESSLLNSSLYSHGSTGRR